MLNGIGFVVILATVFGSFIMSGGKMEIVLHALPHEMLAIAGASIGAFIVSNSIGNVKKAGKGIIRAFKGSRWKDSDYRDLLALLFALLSTFKKGGATGIEPHLDHPEESRLFSRYPRLLADHHLVEFIADYLRMMTVNFEDPHQLAEAMENDIERHHHEELAPQHALQIMADGLPAIGIVAAVLGVIKTMGSIDQPTEILGAMIGGALVGTFLGVFLAYGLVGPIATRLKEVVEENGALYAIIRSVLDAHLHGNAAQISVEIGRGSVPSSAQPSFTQLEESLGNIPAEAA
jgi:chemotaxis protein MotA